MKQEEKDLIFKDLCARLPYKVKVSYYDNETERQECDIVDSMYEDTQAIGVGQWCLKMDEFKPYLIPMSSMTEEQKEELNKVTNGKFYACYTYIDNCKPRNWAEWGTTEYNWIRHCDIDLLYTWLNQNHFDYRGLIEKRLAIDCTNLNIY